MTKDSRGPAIEVLRTFVLFAEAGEVEAAARALGLDQAVVSRRLKDVRTRYGLVQKRGRTLELTEKGRAALPAIRSLLRRHEHLSEWLTGTSAHPHVLSVSTGNVGARLYLPRALALFAAQYPDVQVRIPIRRGRERILAVADGTDDLAIVTHDETQIALVAGRETRLRSEVLAEQPLVLIARRGSASGDVLATLPEGQPVPFERLTELPLVGLDPQSGLRRQIEAHLRAKQIVPRFVYEGGGWDAARELARQGLGAASIPLSLLEPEHSGELILRSLPPSFAVRDRLIDRGPEPDPDRHEALRDAIRQAAREDLERVRQFWGKTLF